MTKKRFTITQKEDYFYVRDEVKKKPMGMFEFKEDEFPIYFCFHKIIDLLNQLDEDNNALIKIIKNQSYIIQQLHTKLIEYELKEPIKLTVEDIELMGKAISYYTHGRYAE